MYSVYTLNNNNIFKYNWCVYCICTVCVYLNDWVDSLYLFSTFTYSHLILHMTHMNSNTKMAFFMCRHTVTLCSIHHLQPPICIWICSLLATIETVTLFWLEAGGQVWLLIGCLGWRVEEKLRVSVLWSRVPASVIYQCVCSKGDMLLEATQSIRHTQSQSDTRAARSSHYVNVSLCMSWCDNWKSHLSGHVF